MMFTVEAQGQRATVQLQLMGRHNVHNALAAIAVGLRSGMTLEECAAALGGLRTGDKRGELKEWRGAKLINDTYNSNPRALDAMVDALLAIPVEGRHIVVAGEMLELGPQGEALHAECGRRMAQHGVDVVVGVRGLAEALVKGASEAGSKALFVSTPEEAGAWVKANVAAGDAVLFKASRGVRLERALAALDES
jgi:UDP-N-acetylmuramoyl-tripeptide--D-alanyl-D-alanine ligase